MTSNSGYPIPLRHRHRRRGPDRQALNEEIEGWHEEIEGWAEAEQGWIMEWISGGRPWPLPPLGTPLPPSPLPGEPDRGQLLEIIQEVGDYVQDLAEQMAAVQTALLEIRALIAGLDGVDDGEPSESDKSDS